MGGQQTSSALALVRIEWNYDRKELFEKPLRALLPYCAWRHLSETATCYPVLCAYTDDEVLNSTLCLFRLPRTGAEETSVNTVLETDTIVGFVCHTRDTVICSGATTPAIHVQILTDTLTKLVKALENSDTLGMWLPYDLHLLRAARDSETIVSVDTMGPPSSLKDLLVFRVVVEEDGQVFNTNLEQEVANLEAMHRQLAPSMAFPAPCKDLIDPFATDKKDDTMFSNPQVVRPMVSCADDKTQLCVHFVNLAPHGAVDTRLASPMASATPVSLSTTIPKRYKPQLSGQRRRLFHGDVIFAEIKRGAASKATPVQWKLTREPLSTQSTTTYVNRDLLLALQRSRGMADANTLDSIRDWPVAKHPVVLDNGDGRSFVSTMTTVEWQSLCSKRCAQSPRAPDAGGRKWFVRMVSDDSVQVKTPSAYARRLTGIGHADSVCVSGNMAEHSVQLRLAQSSWDDAETLEHVFWRQRIGNPFIQETAREAAQETAPGVAPGVAQGVEQERGFAPFFLNIPTSFYFYRTLWYREDEDTILLLPLYNFLMLRDFAGTCVPLHLVQSDVEANGSHSNLRAIRFRRPPPDAEEQMKSAFDAIDTLIFDNPPHKTAAPRAWMRCARRLKLQRGTDTLRYLNENGNAAVTLESFRTQLPASAWFSDPPNVNSVIWRGDENEGIVCAEWLLRRLFLDQMRRICNDAGLSSEFSSALVGQFDEEAGWPAVNDENDTYVVYRCCDTVQDNQMSFTVQVNDDIKVSGARTPFYVGASERDSDAFAKLMAQYAVANRGQGQKDRLRIFAAESNDGTRSEYFASFSPYCSTIVRERNCSDQRGVTVQQDLPLVSMRINPCKKKFRWPLSCYARGAEFFATTSDLDVFLHDPCESTLRKAQCSLQLLSELYRSDKGDENFALLTLEEEQSSREFVPDDRTIEGQTYKDLVQQIVDITTHKLAFTTSQQHRGARALDVFVLELYDSEGPNGELCAAAVLQRLGRQRPTREHVTLTSLELLALYAPLDSGRTPASHYVVDSELASMGCSGGVLADNGAEALRMVLEDLCRYWGTECVVRAAPNSAILYQSLRFETLPFWQPQPREAKNASSFVYKRNVAAVYEELGSHTPPSWKPQRVLRNCGLSLQPMRKTNKGTRNDVIDQDLDIDTNCEFFLFAAPSQQTRRESVLWETPEEGAAPYLQEWDRLPPGVYRPSSLVLHDGLCDMHLDGLEAISLRRVPSFSRVNEVSLDCVGALRCPEFVEHAPAPALPAATRYAVNTAQLLRSDEVDPRPSVRVRFENPSALFEYLRQNHSHVVVLSRLGIERTSIAQLVLSARTLLLDVFASYARDGTFPAHSPFDRRMVFVRADAVVMRVVLLHVSVAGVLGDAANLHDAAEQPGSFLCLNGGCIFFPREHMLPRNDGVSEIETGVYYNYEPGNRWVFAARASQASDGAKWPEDAAEAVDGRCWNGQRSEAWDASLCRVDIGGRISQNCGSRKYLTMGRLSLNALQEERSGDVQFILLHSIRDDENLAHMPRTNALSSKTHARGFLGDLLDIGVATDRITIYAGSVHLNATVCVYALLGEREGNERDDLIASALKNDLLARLRRASSQSAVTTLVDVEVTPLSPLQSVQTSGVMRMEEVAARAGLLATTVRPLVYDGAGRILVPGGGTDKLVSVRVCIAAPDDATATQLRQLCAESVTDALGVSGVVSSILNHCVVDGVSLFNCRAKDARSGADILAAIVPSDVGKRLQVLGGVLRIDGYERTASWSYPPADIDGVIQDVIARVDAAVTLRTSTEGVLRVVANPSRKHRARAETLEQLFCSFVRVGLGRYRVESENK